MELREQVARAIWAKRPDCQGKRWPIETAEELRAYPHNPIAAVDLCYIYADAALEVLARPLGHLTSEAYSAPEGALGHEQNVRLNLPMKQWTIISGDGAEPPK